MSVVVYGFLAYLLIKAVKNWKAKAAILLGGIFFISLIGFSRIYLGVHYPSDVLGGWLLGFFWLTVIITALEIQLKYFPFKNLPVFITSKKFFSASVIALILFFAVFSFEFYQIREPYLLFGEYKNSQIVETPLPEGVFGVLPKSSEMLTGAPMEPISLVFVGSQTQIEKAFNAAGWLEADPITFGSVLKITAAALLRISYPRAPMTPSFFNYLPDNFGFEKQVNSILDRHHLRFWKTNFTYNGENIWVSTASFDEGLKYLITHHIDPNIDKERDFVLTSLLPTGFVKNYREIQLVSPEEGQNQSGDSFFTDGKAYVIFLGNK
jgi:undecaprenyl-diphosphatase